MIKTKKTTLCVLLVAVLMFSTSMAVFAASPYETRYNNTVTASSSVSISDSGLLTIANQFQGIREKTTKGEITTYVEKRTLGFFWTRVDIGQPNNQWYDVVYDYMYIGSHTISFNSKVTNYKLQHIEDPDECNTVYQLEAWSSAWDRMFKRPGAQAVTVPADNSRPLLIYFMQFDNAGSGNTSLCLYGKADPDNSGWVALPGLSLGYWLIINIVLFIILGALWLGARKKEHFRRWVEYLLLIPVAYGLGHLCVLGFRTVSYSEWRDFQLILAIGVLLYCAMLLALNIFYAGKDFLNMHRKDHR